MHDDLQHVLVTEEAIARRTRELGEEIAADYPAEEEMVVIAIINGAILFTADLMRQIDRPLLLDCIRVSSYRDRTDPGSLKVLDHIQLDVEGRPVLVIDDIYDTGRTLAHVHEQIGTLRPSLLKTCVLLEKIGRQEADYRPDYVGFEIPDKFVVGYGLDFAERYRNLPCIGTLRAELQNPPEWSQYR